MLYVKINDKNKSTWVVIVKQAEDFFDVLSGFLFAKPCCHQVDKFRKPIDFNHLIICFDNNITLFYTFQSRQGKWSKVKSYVRLARGWAWSSEVIWSTELFLASNPRERRPTINSCLSTSPEDVVSNKSKASFISSTYSTRWNDTKWTHSSILNKILVQLSWKQKLFHHNQYMIFHTSSWVRPGRSYLLKLKLGMAAWQCQYGINLTGFPKITVLWWLMRRTTNLNKNT